MLIQCTSKLLKKLKIKSQDLPELAKTDPLYSWHANFLTINRRNTLVLVNDSNRYIIVLYGLMAKDFNRLDSIILQAIREVFLHEHIAEQRIKKYLAKGKKFTFTKTKDRTSVSRMNRSIDPIESFTDLINQNEITQIALSARVSRFLITHGELGYISPNEQLLKDFENL